MQTFTETELLRLANVRGTAGLPREFWIDRLELNRMVAEARAEATRDIFRGLVRGVAKLFERVRAWRNYRVAIAELESLDARALEDIGIRRSDIPRVAAGLWMPEPQRPTVTRNAAVSAENENARPLAA